MPTPDAPLDPLIGQIRACRLCADRFAATATGHAPNPVVWLRPGAPILVCGQAPGMRVHKAGKPFFDPSGDRLRSWMGIMPEVFYDQSKIAVLPMAFCFPGYNSKGSDLPPPPLCRATWHTQVMQHLGQPPLILLVGGYAQKWFLGKRAGPVTATVQGWRDHAPAVFPLPHPSWRNTAWLKKNPWFETELLPVLKGRVKELIS